MDPQINKSAPMIELRNVSKWYDSFQALKDVSLTVNKGERVVITGVYVLEKLRRKGGDRRKRDSA